MRRISTPTAAQDLFGPGKHGFRNGDPANAILATRLQAEWFNALQEEMASVVEQAGMTLDPVDNTQLLKAIRALRGGSGTGFGLWSWNTATSGDPGVGKVGLNNASPALVTQVLLAEVSSENVDYSVLLSAAQAGDTLYLQPRDAAALGHRFKVTGAPVDNGAYRSIPVAYIGGSGALPSANTVMLVRLDQTAAADASTDGIEGSFSNLKASATGTNATVTVTADSVCVKSGNAQQKVLSGVSLAINSAAVGANGLDTGALVVSAWYSVWVIWNGAAVAGLLSLSASAPTLPAGYTHKARIGWIRTDGTANKYPLSFVQTGRRVQYKVATGSNLANIPILASGAAGSVLTPTWVSVAMGNYVPPTASAAEILLNVTSQQSAMAAPNNSFGRFDSTSNPPPMSMSSTTAGSGAAGYGWSVISKMMLLESSNIFWASSGSGLLAVTGWEDNL